MASPACCWQYLLLPAKALLLDGGSFLIGGYQRRIAGAVGFARRWHRWQSARRFLLHRPSPCGGMSRECPRRRKAVRIGRSALLVHVDESHLHSSEILQIAVAGVALVVQPFAFGTPMLLGFYTPCAFAAKPKRLEAHGFEGDVARENEKVGPRDLRPYFCLIGHSSRRALSRFALSGQLLSGAKRCWPAPAPPRPSPMR